MCERCVEADGWTDGWNEGGAGSMTEAEMREDDFSPRKLGCPTPEGGDEVGQIYLLLSYWENQNVLQQDLDLFHASGYRC